jgi:hypothetical protein
MIPFHELSTNVWEQQQTKRNIHIIIRGGRRCRPILLGGLQGYQPIKWLQIPASMPFLLAWIDMLLYTFTKPTDHCSYDNDQAAQFSKRKSVVVRPATCLDVMRTFFHECRARLVCGAQKWTEFPQAMIFSHAAYWVNVQSYECEDEMSHFYKLPRFKMRRCGTRERRGRSKSRWCSFVA